MHTGPYPFSVDYVNRIAPASHGVYWLIQSGELIYVGQSQGDRSSIRARLLSHLSGREGYCTQSATHFGYKVCLYPKMEEEQMLRSYRMRYGRLPRCNDIGA